MSAEREELERLVHELPDAQAAFVLANVRRHLRSVEHGSWPPAFFASAPGDGISIADTADELLSQGFGR
jgi:hypothetical protein